MTHLENQIAIEIEGEVCLSGMAFYEIEEEDNSFDYSCGSENGTHRNFETIITQYNLEKVKPYGGEDLDDLIDRELTEEEIEIILDHILENI